MKASTSAKYNINRFGISGMEIHANNGKVLKVFNESKNENTNWFAAVAWGKENIDLIKIDHPLRSGKALVDNRGVVA